MSADEDWDVYPHTGKIISALYKKNRARTKTKYSKAGRALLPPPTASLPEDATAIPEVPGSKILGTRYKMMYPTSMSVPNICDDMKNLMDVPQVKKKKRKLDSFINLKIKRFLHTDIGEEERNQELKQRVLEKLIKSKMKKKQLISNAPPVLYERVTLFLPTTKDTSAWECRKAALIHDFLIEVQNEELAVQQELENIRALTEKADVERNDRKTSISSHHKVFMKVAAQHMNVSLSKIEEGVADDMRCIDLMNDILKQNGGFFIIFTWKVKRFTVYNMRGDLMRVFDEKRVHVSDGTEQCLDYFLLIYRTRNDFTAETKNVYEDYYFQGCQYDGKGVNISRMLAYLMNFNLIPTVSTIIKSTEVPYANITARNWKHVCLNKLKYLSRYLMGTYKNLSNRVTFEYSQEFYDHNMTTQEKRKETILHSDKFKKVENTFESWKRTLWSIICKLQRPRIEHIGSVHIDEAEYWRGIFTLTQSMVDFYKSQVCKDYVTCMKTAESINLTKAYKDWDDYWHKIKKLLETSSEYVYFFNIGEELWNRYDIVEPKEACFCAEGDLFFYSMLQGYCTNFDSGREKTIYMMKASNALLNCFKNYLTDGFTKNIWKQNISDIRVKAKDCINACKRYREIYKDTMALIAQGKGQLKPYTVNESLIFDKMNAFHRRIKKIIRFMELIKEYSVLKKCKIEGLLPYAKEYGAIFRTLINQRDYDCLDPRDPTLDLDLKTAYAKILNIDERLRHFMCDSFAKEPSLEGLVIILKRFENMKLSCLYIGVAYSAALELYSFELNELRDTYNRKREEPMLEPYISPVTGIILWLRVFLIGFVPFMELFQRRLKKHKMNIFDMPGSREIINTYNGFLKALLYYEMMNLDSFFRHFIWIEDFLTRSMIGKLRIGGNAYEKFYINYSDHLRTALSDNDNLLRLGYITNYKSIRYSKEHSFIFLMNQSLIYTFKKLTQLKEYVPPLFEAIVNPVLTKVAKGMTKFYWTTWTEGRAYDDFCRFRESIAHFEKVIFEVINIKKKQIDDIFQLMLDTNYFYLYGSPIGNVEFIQRNLLHQERCLVEVMKQSFIIDKLTRKMVNILIDEMAANSADRAEKRKWLRQKSIFMGFSQDFEPQNISTLSFSDSEEDELVAEDNALDLRAGGVLLCKNDSLYKECMKFYNHFNKQRIDTILACTRRSLRMLLEAILGKKGQQPTAAIYQVEMSLCKPDIVTFPPIKEMQIGLNKIAAGMLRMARDILPWGIAMPSDHVNETKKEVRLFEKFWGVPPDMLQGTGVGKGMGPPPPPPDVCDIVRMECQAEKRKEKEDNILAEIERQRREEEAKRQEEMRLYKLEIKRQRRKQEKFEEHLEMKWVRYITKVRIRETQRRKKEKEKDKSHEEKPFSDFMTEAEFKYKSKISKKLKDHEERVEKKRARQEELDKEEGDDALKQDESKFEDKKLADRGSITKLVDETGDKVEDSVEDLLKLLHGGKVLKKESKVPEEHGETEDAQQAEAEEAMSTSISSVSSVSTPEDVSDEQSIVEAAIEEEKSLSFIMASDQDLKKIRELLGEKSVHEIIESSSSEEEEEQKEVIEGDEPEVDEGHSETDEDEEEEDIDLLLKQIDLDDEKLEIPDFRKVTEDKYVDGTLVRTLFQVVCSHPDIQALVGEVQDAFARITEEMEDALHPYLKYKFLWADNKEEQINDFLKKKPEVSAILAMFDEYDRLKDEILNFPTLITLPPLELTITSFIVALYYECVEWKTILGRLLKEQCLDELQFIYKFIDESLKTLHRPIVDIEDARIALDCLDEIKKNHVNFDHHITKIERIFDGLILYRIEMTREERHTIYDLRGIFDNLTREASNVQAVLCEIQDSLRETLTNEIADFIIILEDFDDDFEKNGPQIEGLTAQVASERVLIYQDKMDELLKRYDRCCFGEILFGLPVTDYPRLNERKKDLNLLQKLYGLYRTVMKTIDGYFDIIWKNVDTEAMATDLSDYQTRCRKLPNKLKTYPAFPELKKKVDDFSECCPILALMANKSMKDRHWKQLEDLLGCVFDVESPTFTLRDVMETPILKHMDDVEDICVSAIKEKDIEFKLRQVQGEWQNVSLTFSNFKGRGDLLLKGTDTAEIIGATEDSLMILGSLNSNRYNAFYKREIQDWINKLATTEFVLEKWLGVQNLWMYLEGVFLDGDISKQMPFESKKFASINKTWIKTMHRATEVQNCLKVCVADENMKIMLPKLLDDLESCQKSLIIYLEQKRKLFPRFFFVSDPSLLEILGQASDPRSIQDHLLGVFENVAKVEFFQGRKEEIVSIISREGEKIKLLQSVHTRGGVELWLGSLLYMAKLSLGEIIRKCWKFITKAGFRIINMVEKFPSQIGLLGLQMLWTGEAENALDESKNNPSIMRKTNDYFLKVLNVLIDMTTKDLTKYERVRYETLVTIHVHQRDIFDDIYRMGITDSEDFEWQKQERFYYGNEQRECVVCITDVIFIYQNEFMGCSDRLVITPLTDRCYITLAQAIGMAMGGAPAGPAGTGKTETTKDMGKSLGKYVVVFNCSDQMDFRGLGRIFKGLAQSGSWGCFDEFNRIELPVLSVAAQQISIVLIARRDLEKFFIFSDGDRVDLNMEFGIFLTMNPGYAGRQELPENLKVMFRTVAMMVPDRYIIMRVKLASCGYRENVLLARKFFVLYKLCEEQLSKQVHYDFGLRNILSVLRTLGAQKRANPTETEDTTLMRVLRDMNVSKLVDEDEPLFMSLINDLFPGLKVTTSVYKELQNAIKQVCERRILTNHPNWNLKIVQLFETSLVRHGLMTMGPTGSGKTSCIHVLMECMTICGRPHSEMRMNPKAITAPQMFGRLDVATNDWTDGIFSTLWRRSLKTPPESNVWLVLDGPVDAVWIENLNSVLDDNKTLTLANGDRIVMAPNSKLVFEPDNVDNASPATVSRMGMVFLSSSVLSWKPIVDAWLRKRPPNESELLAKLFYSIYDDAHSFMQAKLKAKMNILEALYIRQFTDILEGLLIGRKKKDPNQIINEDDEEDVKKAYEFITYNNKQIEHYFLFGLLWTLGAVLELDNRLMLETFLLEHESKLSWPTEFVEEGDTIFEYYVDEDGNWAHWLMRVQEYVYPRDYEPEYATILVPNVDNTRTTFLIDLISSQRKAVLLIGEQGTAKTVMLKSYMSKYNPEFQTSKSLNFSFATTPNMFQAIIESYVEKRVGLLRFGPPNMKRMTVFIDDVNMPVINEWGDQVTNEIVRQLMENGGFFSLEKPGEFLTMVDLQFVAAMIHPGGGRNDIPPRLKRRFNIFNCTIPSDRSMDKIFGVFGEGYFSSNRFRPEVTGFVPLLIPLTRIIWQKTKLKMLPTPAKFHYIFNLRDLSRIWEGMLTVKGPECQNMQMLIKLWKHECTRVIADRFTEEKDKAWFRDTLTKTFHELMSVAHHKHYFPGDTYFVDFLRDAPEPTGDEPEDFVMEAPKIYEEIPSDEFLREKLLIYMSQYNETVRGSPMDLVFFKDAMVHLSIISRIIRTARGSAMLVGVGGSGKQSLTKLSSFIANYKTHQITLTRTYNVGNFMEDLKYLYRIAGAQCQGISFLFTDNDIKDEAFLEFLNNVLSAGEVANLFAKDEQEEILNDLLPRMRKKEPKTPLTMENLYNFFIRQARNNLHIVLCFSPVSEKFRSRALKFPGLISGCTIDWFFRWPRDALVAVARHFLEHFPIVSTPEVKLSLISLMGEVHDHIADSCVEYYDRYRRRTYVTPKSFLSFLEGYKLIYEAKHKEIELMAIQMSTGLIKLKEAAEGVEVLRIELEAKNEEILIATRAAEKVLEEVFKKADATMEVKAEAEEVAERAQDLVRIITIDKKFAEEKLAAAQPALEAAEAALQTIKPADIATVRKLGRPPYLITVIMDAVLLLFGRKLMRDIDQEHSFFLPNWTEALRMMADTKFLFNLQNYPRDKITAEVVDMLQPYFNLPIYTFQAAQIACGNVAGLLQWTIAMANFYAINKDVLPLKANLIRQEGKLRKAQAKYDEVMTLLHEKEAELQKTQEELDRAMAEKNAVLAEAQKCKDKMDAASALVTGLAGEQARWKEQLKGFEMETQRLVGDVLVLTGFLSYSGPFNAEFRTAMRKSWFDSLYRLAIPVTQDLNIVANLVDTATIGEWNLQGLPSDDLSIQNGIIVTKAARYPLLIDPQNQGVNWIKNKEKDFSLQVTVLQHKYFRQHLEDCLSLGKPLLIEDVLEELDPVLDNVLERNFIKVGRSLKVKLADKEVDVHKSFRMYMTTKLANPSYTPEIYARTSIIDFTVTMLGLEEQLLGRVILSEREELEAERTALIAEVTQMKRTMKQLEQDLLKKLNSVKGSLVDDHSVMVVLNNTKNTSKRVTKKLEFAVEAEKKIIATRDLYRDVATRGSILYFLIVEMSLVNCMYQTSLVQFLERFEISMLRTEKAPVPRKRVDIIIEYLTFDVFKYKCRGLYEEHKHLFTLLVTLKIDVHRGTVSHGDFTSFIKGGAALDLKDYPGKPESKWLTDIAWLNLAQLSKNPVFSTILSEVINNENVFKVWYENPEPEQEPLPLKYEKKCNPFQKLMFVRSLCPDRTWAQCEKYITYSLGEQFVEPVVLKMPLLISESRPNTPMSCFLSMGSDPTSLIEQTARKERIPFSALSMGQGQEIHARAMLAEKIVDGGWLLLQNCHLGIDYMNELFIVLTGGQKLHNDFRLWLTTEPNIRFPINLLQMCVKFTNEPPQGVRAGLLRTYSSMGPDMLEFSNYYQYRPLIYAISFLHSVVQERRKFGPLGWNIPYEFNFADWYASCLFVQNHVNYIDLDKGVDWTTLRYMISEVQYGGRVTDDYDKRLLITLTDNWFHSRLFDEDFEFFRGYKIYSFIEVDPYIAKITDMSPSDPPQVFGLHPNANITSRTNETNMMLDTILLIQPKESSQSSGETREDIVMRQAKEMIDKVPKDYDPFFVRERLKVMGHLKPLNIFLRQEIDRMQKVIRLVRVTLKDLVLAIEGTIIMNEGLRDALDCIFDAKVPGSWMKVSWEASSIGFWFTDLLERNHQFSQWIEKGRPVQFWMSGFFNPQGFLTAMRQEVSRAHEGWALDSVTLHNTVTKMKKEDVRMPPMEGVYVYGLFLEGASWDVKNDLLQESFIKVLFSPIPVLHVFAINSTAPKSEALYTCPVYKKIRRTGLNFITPLWLPCKYTPLHWILRGTALLCDTK